MNISTDPKSKDLNEWTPPTEIHQSAINDLYFELLNPYISMKNTFTKPGFRLNSKEEFLLELTKEQINFVYNYTDLYKTQKPKYPHPIQIYETVGATGLLKDIKYSLNCLKDNLEDALNMETIPGTEKDHEIYKFKFRYCWEKTIIHLRTVEYLMKEVE